MPITIEPTEIDGLTRITLDGKVSIQAFLKALDAYGQRGTSRLEIYDLSRLDGKRFSTKDIDILVDYLTGFPNRRPSGGKTAIVAARTVDIGITRMISMLSAGEVSYKIEAFLTIEEAMEWLLK